MPQAFTATTMAEAVIVLLEEVYIEQDKRQGSAGPHYPTSLLLQPLVKGTFVGQPCEAISCCLLLQLQLKRPLSEHPVDSEDQFPRFERLLQVIGCTGL